MWNTKKLLKLQQSSYGLVKTSWLLLTDCILLGSWFFIPKAKEKGIDLCFCLQTFCSLYPCVYFFVPMGKSWDWLSQCSWTEIQPTTLRYKGGSEFTKHFHKHVAAAHPQNGKRPKVHLLKALGKVRLGSHARKTLGTQSKADWPFSSRLGDGCRKVCLRLPERKNPPKATCIALRSSTTKGRCREGILAGVVIRDQPIIEGLRREKFPKGGWIFLASRPWVSYPLF